MDIEIYEFMFNKFFEVVDYLFIVIVIDLFLELRKQCMSEVEVVFDKFIEDFIVFLFLYSMFVMFYS